LPFTDPTKATASPYPGCQNAGGIRSIDFYSPLLGAVMVDKVMWDATPQAPLPLPKGIEAGAVLMVIAVSPLWRRGRASHS
jgi:hypothetical protein